MIHDYKSSLCQPHPNSDIWPIGKQIWASSVITDQPVPHLPDREHKPGNETIKWVHVNVIN